MYIIKKTPHIFLNTTNSTITSLPPTKFPIHKFEQIPDTTGVSTLRTA